MTRPPIPPRPPAPAQAPLPPIGQCRGVEGGRRGPPSGHPRAAGDKGASAQVPGIGTEPAHAGERRSKRRFVYRRPPMTDDAEALRHKRKMAHRKAVQDAEVASKTTEKGLLIVMTGPGKGKSHRRLRPRAPHARPRPPRRRRPVHQGRLGHRRARRLRPLRRPRHLAHHGRGLHLGDPGPPPATSPPPSAAGTRPAPSSPTPPSASSSSTSSTSRCATTTSTPPRVVATLTARRPDLHVVVTGRNAKPELLAAADLVTEMGQAKHHFAAGVKAQEGIEF